MDIQVLPSEEYSLKILSVGIALAPLLFEQGEILTLSR